MRNSRLYLLILLCGSLLAGCASGPRPPNIAVTGNTLRIEGRITAKTAERFNAVLQNQEITRVQLNSPGGDVEPSIDIGTAIFRNGMDVEVVGDCLSSCANYLFPAGRHKVISGPGVVAWHGNIQHLVYLHESGERVMVQPTYEGLLATAKREADFFALVGVNPFICWFGKIAPFKVRNFYFLSVEDMARFGITDVTARAGYEETDTGYMDQFFFISNLKRLDVDWNTYQAVAPQPESTL